MGICIRRTLAKVRRFPPKATTAVVQGYVVSSVQACCLFSEKWDGTTAVCKATAPRIWLSDHTAVCVQSVYYITAEYDLTYVHTSVVRFLSVRNLICLSCGALVTLGWRRKPTARFTMSSLIAMGMDVPER